MIPDKITLKNGDALIVVDVQNDFLPGGSLGVRDGDRVVSVLNDYIALFEGHQLPVYATRDWHPPDHCSFKAQGGVWPPHYMLMTDIQRSVLLTDLYQLTMGQAYFDQGMHVHAMPEGTLFFPNEPILQEYAGLARRKRSEGKAIWPGRKKVYRHYAPDGALSHDVLTLESDAQDGEPLTKLYMQAGKRLQAGESLADIQNRAASQLQRFPPQLRQLDAASLYDVRVSSALRVLPEEVDRRQS